MTLDEALEAFGLAPPRNRAPRVAIVDSGVYAEHPHVQRVAGGISFVGDAADIIDRNGHGTAVAAAIREKAPTADLFAVKIFDRTLAARASDLVRAIDWAAGQSVDLVNLSLGTTNAAHGDALQAAVDRARAAGAAVVAAAMQGSLPSLPGSLRGVIAVTLDWEMPRDQVAVDAAGRDAVRLRASGYPRPVPGLAPERNLKGVSFAVANASGVIARTFLSARG